MLPFAPEFAHLAVTCCIEPLLPNILHNLSELPLSKALNWVSFYYSSSTCFGEKRTDGMVFMCLVFEAPSNPDLQTPSDQTSQADLISRASDWLWSWRQTTREDMTSDPSLCF